VCVQVHCLSFRICTMRSFLFEFYPIPQILENTQSSYIYFFISYFFIHDPMFFFNKRKFEIKCLSNFQVSVSSISSFQNSRFKDIQQSLVFLFIYQNNGLYQKFLLTCFCLQIFFVFNVFMWFRYIITLVLTNNVSLIGDRKYIAMIINNDIINRVLNQPSQNKEMFVNLIVLRRNLSKFYINVFIIFREPSVRVPINFE